MIKKYVEKEPSIKKAVQWKGDNFEEVDKFCTIKIDDTEVHYAEPSQSIWIGGGDIIALRGDMWCGDVAYEKDYIVCGDEFYAVKPEEFESEWEQTEEPHIYKRKEPLVLEAIKWTDDNTEEVLEFLGDRGGLEGTNTQILVMNNSGGAVLVKGYYLVKCNDEFYTMFGSSFEENYKEL